MHIHQQAREAVLALLTGLTTSGNRVYLNRMQRLAEGLSPGLVIRTTQAERDPSRGSMSKTHDWELTFEVIAYAHSNDETTVANLLDDMAEEVEAALAADDTLSGIVEDIAPTSMAYEYDVGNETISGTCAMTYIANYRHIYGAANTPEG